MKLEALNGVVSLTSENTDDATKLLSFFAAETGVTFPSVPQRKPMPRVKANGKRGYKQQRTKNCPQCGKAVKGGIGLGRHRAVAHRLLDRETLEGIGEI